MNKKSKLRIYLYYSKKKYSTINFVKYFIIASLITVGLSSCTKSDDKLPHDAKANLLPLTDFKVSNPELGARISLKNGKLYVTTVPQKWSYAAIASLQNVNIPKGPIIIVVKSKVLNGLISFGIVTNDLKNYIIEKTLKASSDYEYIQLHLSSLETGNYFVIRTQADNGQVSKAIVHSIELVADKDYQIKFYPNDTKFISTVLLHHLILKDYPEINDTTITDWEKVNILRQWAHENTDYAASTGALLDRNLSNYYKLDAPAIFAAFYLDKGGVWCGGTAYGLMKLYELFGYKSYTYDFGYADHLSHVITLVEIDHKGEKIITIQDAYFNITYVDQMNNPYDFFEILKTIKNYDLNQIKVLKGKNTARDIILDHIPEKDRAPRSWVFKNDKNITFIKYLSPGWTKFKSDTTYEEYYGDFINKLHLIFPNEKFPDEMEYMLLCPWGIRGNNNEKLLDKIKTIVK